MLIARHVLITKMNCFIMEGMLYQTLLCWLYLVSNKTTNDGRNYQGYRLYTLENSRHFIYHYIAANKVL